MAIISTPVLEGDPILWTQYNGLRTDLLGHTHDGVDTPALRLANNQYLQGLDSLAAQKNLIGITGANIVTVGASGLTVSVPVATTITAGGLGVLAGNVGVGIAQVAQNGVFVQGAALSGSPSQAAAYLNATYSSAATTQAFGVLSRINTAAAAFTVTSAYAFYAANPVKGAGSAITSAYGAYVEAITAGATANYGVYINPPSGATTNIGLYNIGTSRLDGNVSLGSNPPTWTALGVFTSITSDGSTGGYGITNRNQQITAAVNADALFGFSSQPQFLLAGKTGVSCYGLHVAASWAAAGVNTGVYVATVTSATTNYGVYINAPTGGTTNIGLVNSGTTFLGANLGVGVSPVTYAGVYVNGSILSGSTSQYGVISTPVVSSAATVTGQAVYASIATAAAAFTLGSGYGALIDAPALGAGSAVTTLHGVHVNNQGAAGVTNAVGVYIAAQSGAATTNYGLYNAGTSMLVGNTGFFGATPLGRQTITGSRSGGAALVDLLSKLALIGLITDSTTA